MPKRLSSQRIISPKIALPVPAKHPPSRRAQQTLGASLRRMLPNDFAGFIVDSPQVVSHAPDATLSGAVALRMRVGICQVKHGVRLRRAHIEETSVRIEAGGRPVR